MDSNQNLLSLILYRIGCIETTLDSWEYDLQKHGHFTMHVRDILNEIYYHAKAIVENIERRN